VGGGRGTCVDKGVIAVVLDHPTLHRHLDCISGDKNAQVPLPPPTHSYSIQPSTAASDASPTLSSAEPTWVSTRSWVDQNINHQTKSQPDGLRFCLVIYVLIEINLLFWAT